MTSIRFVGDLPLWAGALVALLAGLGTWWFYRRESFDLPGHLRWVLPLLRAVAILLCVFILTGPVLHHRLVIGQLGRVLVFLDSSQSMEVTDDHMPDARKLLVAQQQGWLPPGHVDMTLWELSDSLAQVRRDAATVLQTPPIEGDALDACRRGFAQGLEGVCEALKLYPWESLLGGGDPGEEAPWHDVAARFEKELVEPARSLLDEPLDDADAQEQVAQRVLQLNDAAMPFENALWRAFDAYGEQLAASGSQSIASALTLFDETSRWRRSENRLLDADSGLLAQLTRTHDVRLFALSGANAEGLWDGRVSELPAKLGLDPLGQTTDLSSGITGELTAMLGGETTAERSADDGQRTAVVLVTDGRHNHGSSPLQMARVLGGQEIPVYAVGVGCRREPPDLALLEAEYPDMVFQKDRIRGTLVVKDQMPPGRSFVVQIGHQDEVLWQQQLDTQDAPLRRVEFEFSIDELVDRLRTQFDPRVRHHAFPLSLQASIAPLEGETETTNNELEMRFAAITQSYRLLILDGRSRWETRYLRNVFERDEQWDVDTVLAGPATDQASLPRGDGPDTFPSDQAALFDYDLIVFGEIPPDLLADHEQGWIRAFVENRGGGIIFIDGHRKHLQHWDEDNLGALLPVSWTAGDVNALPSQLQLTEDGRKQNALMLESNSQANDAFWRALPVPHQFVAVEAEPGTERLVETVVNDVAFPVVITRPFGAGRVLYFAFDETWRWRYKVADTCHQRFWNQVAKWIMQRPFTVSDEYVSLDTGPPSYARGESAELRVRLRGVDGRPVSGATVDALVWQHGRIVSTVTLAADETGNGIYRGRTGPLVEGAYEVTVRASGFSQETMKARTRFVVQAPESGELQQVSCHDELLREMVAASGGRFLREEQLEQLAEMLRPLSSGHVLESDTLLWQSYWWFAAIVGLLAIEWTLRKRAGLL